VIGVSRSENFLEKQGAENREGARGSWEYVGKEPEPRVFCCLVYFSRWPFSVPGICGFNQCFKTPIYRDSLYYTSPPDSSSDPGVFCAYFYNHADHPRLEKLSYLQ
jgi:hypothetical protein